MCVRVTLSYTVEITVSEAELQDRGLSEVEFIAETPTARLILATTTVLLEKVATLASAGHLNALDVPQPRTHALHVARALTHILE